MSKKIIQLGAGPLMIHSIKKIRQLGHEVYVADKNPIAPGFNYANGYKTIDIVDADKILSYAKEIKADAIIAVNEAGVYTEAFVSQQLNLTGNDPESTRYFTDKGFMREKWKKKKLLQPNFLIATSQKEIKEAIHTLKLPVILKPCLNWGSRGVSLIKTEEDIEWAIHFATAHNRNERYIVEKYIEGVEMTIEGLVNNGELFILATSDKIAQKHEKFRVAMSLNYPSYFNQEVMLATKELMQKAVESIGIQTGAVHAEVMVNKEGIYLIELAGRPGGGHIFGLIVEAVSGISMPQALAKIKLKEEVNLIPSYQKGACYRFFTPPLGIFKKITGLEEAKSLDSILDMDFQLKPGALVTDIAGDADRPGYIVSTGETRKHAMDHAEKALNALHFETEPSSHS